MNELTRNMRISFAGIIEKYGYNNVIIFKTGVIIVYDYMNKQKKRLWLYIIIVELIIPMALVLSAVIVAVITKDSNPYSLTISLPISLVLLFIFRLFFSKIKPASPDRIKEVMDAFNYDNQVMNYFNSIIQSGSLMSQNQIDRGQQIGLKNLIENRNETER